MGVNEGPHPDNKSECEGCGAWVDDQTLQSVEDELLCAECAEDWVRRMEAKDA